MIAFKVRLILWAISLLLTYPLYSAGQLYLFISKQKDDSFYKLIRNYPAEWINAHIMLMMSMILLIPAYMGICHYFRNTKAYLLIQLSFFFICIAAFVLFGQFVIDLTIPAIFKLPEQQAYAVLDSIQGDPIIHPLFYDNSQMFFLLKYFDWTLLSQVLLGVALIISKRIPVWAIVAYFVALVLTQFGILIDPFYGRIIKRCSYLIFTISLLPVILGLLREKTKLMPGREITC